MCLTLAPSRGVLVKWSLRSPPQDTWSLGRCSGGQRGMTSCAENTSRLVVAKRRAFSVAIFGGGWIQLGAFSFRVYFRCNFR